MTAFSKLGITNTVADFANRECYKYNIMANTWTQIASSPNEHMQSSGKHLNSL